MGSKNKNSTAQFIEKAIKKHGSKFDYSKVDYIGSHTKVCIICPEHGEFFQSPTNHLSGNGCMECTLKYKRGKYRLTTLDTFINQAEEIHGKKYDYSKVEWKNTKTPITIVCPVHGEFNQVPQNHIRLKCGCRECGRLIAKKKVNKYNTAYFLKHAKKVHGNRYDYTNTQCLNATDKVIIACAIHGKFTQNANVHLEGHGCPQCNFDQMAKDRAMGKELFIERAKKFFGDKYDYSKVEYTSGQRLVNLICPTHGEFTVTPSNHLSKKSGCPICNQSKLERDIAFILDKQNVKYQRQKRFIWLKKQSVDIFLPEFNLAIECQGVQHFKPVDFAGKGEEWAFQLFKENKERDDRKLKICLSNDINMVYIVDKKEFTEHKYHFDIGVPFSENVNYIIIHIKNFEGYIRHLIEIKNAL